jgi:hypothetical protein
MSPARSGLGGMPIVFVGMIFKASANSHGHEAVAMPPDVENKLLKGTPTSPKPSRPRPDLLQDADTLGRADECLVGETVMREDAGQGSRSHAGI